MGIGSQDAGKVKVHPDPDADASIVHEAGSVQGRWSKVANRKSYQLKALSLKAVSYQKRQVFSNLCCISICPLMMVAISAALGALIMSLISKNNPSINVMYCSNYSALDTNGFPIYNYSDPRITTDPTTGASAVDYAFYNGITLDAGNPGAALLSLKHPCVYWFGQDYPANSPDIYERSAGTFGLAKMDSTYSSPPDGGWLTFMLNAASSNSTDVQNAISRFAQLEMRPWSITAARQGLEGFLGVNPPTPSIDTVGALFSLLTTPIGPATAPAYLSAPSSSGGRYGLMGSVESRYYVNSTSSIASSWSSLLSNASATAPFSLQSVPYSVPINVSSSGSTSIVDSDLDDALSQYFASMLNALAQLDKSILSKSASQRRYSELVQFYSSANDKTSLMPYSAVYLDQFSEANLSARIILHVGSDNRLEAAASFPSVGQRQILQMAQLNSALLRAFGMTGATITQGLRIFPNVQNTAFSYDFSGLIGRILFPFGVSFLMPIFVVTLVKEKEDRILIMMKMNGMKIWAYYLIHYATFFILFIISSAIFIVSGFMAKLEFFRKTEKGVILLLFFFWGHVQITLAFFLASIFSKSRVALVMSFLVVQCSVMIALVFDNLFSDTSVPYAVFIWPPFAFYRALGLINLHSYSSIKLPYKMSMLIAGDEVYTAIMFLIGGIFIYGLLAVYLSQVLPSDFGVRRPWHFPVSSIYWLFFKRQSNLEQKMRSSSKVDVEGGVIINPNEDDDVRAERQRVSNSPLHDSPLKLHNVRKVFPSRRGLGPKPAVRSVSFAVDSDVVMGLLGPNGAGKTTIISMLTGIQESTSGVALVGGLEIGRDSDRIYRMIGVCPQFDILWDDLTVIEHLYFYARLKGVQSKDIKAAVERSMADVSLTTLASRTTKGLSGGEKRRLSIAIALVGDPLVVFLDEPTTGLDPEVRRMIWSIIQRSRAGKTIILTTHSMEEAEALCQRIGIMAKGTLRCIANPLRLKELYGSGFKLFFNSHDYDTSRASEWVESLLPDGWRKVDAFATNTSYEFPPAPGVIARLFNQIESGKADHGILDWGISQTTLEEVFLKIITEDDANAD